MKKSKDSTKKRHKGKPLAGARKAKAPQGQPEAPADAVPIQIGDLFAKIGQLTVVNDQLQARVVGLQRDLQYCQEESKKEKK